MVLYYYIIIIYYDDYYHYYSISQSFLYSPELTFQDQLSFILSYVFKNIYIFKLLLNECSLAFISMKLMYRSRFPLSILLIENTL